MWPRYFARIFFFGRHLDHDVLVAHQIDFSVLFHLLNCLSFQLHSRTSIHSSTSMMAPIFQNICSRKTCNYDTSSDWKWNIKFLNWFYLVMRFFETETVLRFMFGWGTNCISTVSAAFFFWSIRQLIGFNWCQGLEYRTDVCCIWLTLPNINGWEDSRNLKKGSSAVTDFNILIAHLNFFSSYCMSWVNAMACFSKSLLLLRP